MAGSLHFKNEQGSRCQPNPCSGNPVRIITDRSSGVSSLQLFFPRKMQPNADSLDRVPWMEVIVEQRPTCYGMNIIDGQHVATQSGGLSRLGSCKHPRCSTNLLELAPPVSVQTCRVWGLIAGNKPAPSSTNLQLTG